MQHKISNEINDNEKLRNLTLVSDNNNELCNSNLIKNQH